MSTVPTTMTMVATTAPGLMPPPVSYITTPQKAQTCCTLARVTSPSSMTHSRGTTDRPQFGHSMVSSPLIPAPSCSPGAPVVMALALLPSSGIGQVENFSRQPGREAARQAVP